MDGAFLIQQPRLIEDVTFAIFQTEPAQTPSITVEAFTAPRPVCHVEPSFRGELSILYGTANCVFNPALCETIFSRLERIPLMSWLLDHFQRFLPGYSSYEYASDIIDYLYEPAA